MKHILTFCLLALAMTAAVTGTPRGNEPAVKAADDDVQLIDESEYDSVVVDSLGGVPVVAAFGVNDTMAYIATEKEYDVAGSDTTVQMSVAVRYIMMVTASTEDNYTMRLEVTDVEGVNDDFKSKMRATAFNAIKLFPVVVTTDFDGAKPKIVNWLEVGKRMLHACENCIDSAFKANPQLGKVVKADAMKELYSQTLTDEEGVNGTFDMLGLMFSNHGSEFSMGETSDTVAATDDSPAYIIKSYADYGRLDDEDKETEFDDDYFVLSKVSSKLDGKDVAPIVSGVMTALLKEKSGADKKAIDKELAKIKEIEVSHESNKFYYFNGWPKACQEVTSTDLGIVKRVKRSQVTCGSFSWGNAH